MEVDIGSIPRQVGRCCTHPLAHVAVAHPKSGLGSRDSFQ